MKKKKGISMHKIKEVLRLHYSSGLSQRKIAASLNLSVGAVNKYLDLAMLAKVGWPLPDNMTDEALADLLKKTKSVHERMQSHFLPIDSACLHKELKRKHV